MTIVSVLAGLGGAAQSNTSEWKLRKNENGIQVYTRKAEGTSIDELKVLTSVHASLSSILAVLLDTPNYPQWVYGCEEGKVLNRLNETEQYQYQKLDLPSPFSDRDVVVHFTIRQDTLTKIVYTRSLSAPEYIDEKKDIVRLKVFEASYQLTPQPDGSVQILYLLKTDPGGYIPNWLVNLTFVTGPYESLSNLSMQAQSDKYRDKKLAFIKE